MVDVKTYYLLQQLLRLFPIAQTQMSESFHQQTVDAVAQGQVVIPDKEVGQRHCKVINFYLVEIMLLAVTDQTMEKAPCLGLVAKLPPGQSLIEDFIGLLVVVKEGDGRLCRTLGGMFKTAARFLCISHALIGTAHPVVHVIFFGIDEFSLTQIFRIGFRQFQLMQGFLILFAGKVLLGLLYVRKDKLSGHFSFTSLPGMELAFCQQVASRCIVAQLVVKRDALHTEVVPLFHKLTMLFQKIKPLAVGHTAFL